MHRLHVLTTLALSHAALENLLARPDADGRCGIINVSSVAGFEQAPTSVSYNATKAWMTSFTNGLAIELAVQAIAGESAGALPRLYLLGIS